jgi:hypothetical protein
MEEHRASRIMRTTLDLDPAVVRELKRRERETGKSISELASELLTLALHKDPLRRPSTHRFAWRSARMGARVDLDDKQAVRQALEAAELPG